MCPLHRMQRTAGSLCRNVVKRNVDPCLTHLQSTQLSGVLPRKLTRGGWMFTAPSRCIASSTSWFQCCRSNASNAGATPLTSQPVEVEASTKPGSGFPLCINALVKLNITSLCDSEVPAPLMTKTNSTASKGILLLFQVNGAARARAS